MAFSDAIASFLIQLWNSINSTHSYESGLKRSSPNTALTYPLRLRPSRELKNVLSKILFIDTLDVTDKSKLNCKNMPL